MMAVVILVVLAALFFGIAAFDGRVGWQWLGAAFLTLASGCTPDACLTTTPLAVRRSVARSML
jgi:hypothetical protein